MALRVFLLALAWTAIPAQGMAQTAPVDPRWAPYLGCWQLQRESTGIPVADLQAVASRRAQAGASREDVMICVTPAADANAVSQQTVLNGDSVLDEIVAADGTPRTGEDGSCRSTRRAEWSTSGRQLFTRGTVSCEGQPERTISGLSLVMPGPIWVDVQMVEVRGNRSVRVRRYGLSREQQRVNRESGTAAASVAFDRWTLDEVKAAARHTAPEVLQAALIEVGAKLPLSARRLVELDEAGVPGPVVDVMVALSFPEKFVIDPPGGSNSGGFGGYGGGFGGTLDPWLVASELGWLSLYSPFGYQYYGYYDPRYGPGWGTWVGVVPPVDGGGSVLEDPNGRVINGLGYTRVRPRDPEPRVGGGIVDRSGHSSGRDGGSNGSGDSGGGSGVTSGGYTSGGGGGASSGSGRTAVPRPPGGGDR
jgi:hypothetical protein